MYISANYSYTLCNMQLSNEMRKWKCDKFELPSEVTFNDIVSLSLSINVSESELTALEDAFASKLVADAAMSTNTTVQPHLGVRDLAQLSKSIGRYLTKNTHFNNSFSVVSSRVAGLGLMSPFSHSGFLDTPIEDFNSVANFNEKTQKDLSAVFIELVELNKQVESDKEVYLFKIVSTSQKLDSLKNELDVLTTKEFVAKDFYALIKSELSAAMESETVGSISGSIHNSQALGLGSFHGHSSHGINSSVHSSRDSMLLTAPYKDIEIQTHASLDSSESPVRNARKTSPRVVDLPRIHLGSHDQGILGIVAYTKVRTPKQQSELEIRHRNSEDRKNIDSSLRRNEKHGNKISASPSRHSIDNESTSPIRPQSVMSTQLTSPEGSEDSYQPRTRRYIRGRPSPAKNTVRQTSFEDIDLGDPGDAYYTTMDSSSTSKEVHVDAFHKSGASAAHNGGSSWSFFSRKTAPPPVVAGGLLQAVKTGRRAAHIMELDIHHDVSVESSSIPNVENSESERSVITLSEPASKLTENSNLHVNALHSTVNSENSILQMMSASTTKFIPDPTLHQDGGALVTVLGIATSWATGSKKDAATLKRYTSGCVSLTLTAISNNAFYTHFIVS